MRAGIPHHLLDIVDPKDDFRAVDFYDQAHAAARDILSRGKLPIIVGGTGFYLRMFMFSKPLRGKTTAGDLQRARRLIDDAKSARARQQGVALADLTAAEAWTAGVSVIRDLGDPQGAERCAATLISCRQARDIVACCSC